MFRRTEEPRSHASTRIAESRSIPDRPSINSLHFLFILFFPKRGCWCACRPPNNRGAGSSEEPARHPSAGLIAPSTARGLLAARSPDRERQARGSRVLRRPRAISQDRLWICLAPRGERSDAVSFFDPPPLETFAAQIRSPHFFFFFFRGSEFARLVFLSSVLTSSQPTRRRQFIRLRALARAPTAARLPKWLFFFAPVGIERSCFGRDACAAVSVTGMRDDGPRAALGNEGPPRNLADL